ncbi:MAG: hypothetical protein ACLQVD_11475 [Capsulimonadaceae bacterium]
MLFTTIGRYIALALLALALSPAFATTPPHSGHHAARPRPSASRKLSRPISLGRGMTVESKLPPTAMRKPSRAPGARPCLR